MQSRPVLLGDSDEGRDGIIIQGGLERSQHLCLGPGHHFLVGEKAVLEHQPVAPCRHEHLEGGQALLEGRRTPYGYNRLPPPVEAPPLPAEAPPLPSEAPPSLVVISKDAAGPLAGTAVGGGPAPSTTSPDGPPRFISSRMEAAAWSSSGVGGFLVGTSGAGESAGTPGKARDDTASETGDPTLHGPITPVSSAERTI
ncbi:unnamed protein product [Lampetra fluviatilis]